MTVLCKTFSFCYILCLLQTIQVSKLYVYVPDPRKYRDTVQMFMHHENMPMQYTAIFHCCKNGKFQMKKCDFFLNFAPNIACGYMFS